MKNSQSTSASYMWEIDIVHILHKKMWNDIHHLYGVFFCIHASFSYFYKHFHMSHTNMHLSHNRSFHDNHNSSHSKTHYHTFTTPFLKTCDMWWKWWKWKYIQNHDIDHHKNYHDYNQHNHHQNDHNIKTVQ